MEKLFKALSSGVVNIKFISVNSGTETEIPCTLQGLKFKQHYVSDKIVVWRIDTKTYEDIVVSSITDWAPTMITKWRKYG